jgi:tRNA threonylcarbamoyladenosine biosynthesis protein TsaE
MFEYKSFSPEDTAKLGKAIGESLSGGEVLCFSGDLGAGKTTLTKSIAEGMGIVDYITSPTFTIINEYDGEISLYHFDVYRLGDCDELYDIGYEDYIDSDGVCIIEWSNLVEDALPNDRLEIRLLRTGDMDERSIELEAKGQKYEKLIESIEGKL